MHMSNDPTAEQQFGVLDIIGPGIAEIQGEFWVLVISHSIE